MIYFILINIIVNIYISPLYRYVFHTYLMHFWTGFGAASQAQVEGEDRQESRCTDRHKAACSGCVAQVTLAGVAALHLPAVGHRAFVVLLPDGLEVAVAGHNRSSAVCGSQVINNTLIFIHNGCPHVKRIMKT